MSDETTTDHSETIEKARRLLTEVTPGRWEWLSRDHRPQGKLIHIPVDATGFSYATIAEGDIFMDGEPRPFIAIDNPDNADAIAAIPDLLVALVALADERDALRARVAELEGQSEENPIVEIAPVSYGGEIQCYRYRVLANAMTPYAFGFGRDFTEAAQRADEVIKHFKVFGWGDNQP